MTYTLYNADCFNILPTIKENSIDMVLADLPYGTTACKWDTVLDLDLLWKHYKRICKDNSAIVLTASQPFTTILVQSNIQEFRYELIWEKPQGTNPLLASKMPMKSHENILVFYTKSPVYNPQMETGKPYAGFESDTSKIGEVYGSGQSKHAENHGTRFPKSILRFKQERGLHPTQKPVELMEWLIRTFSNIGDTVLDNTMGSGTTGVACLNTKREFIGIEMDKEYYNIAEKRLEKTSNNLEFLF